MTLWRVRATIDDRPGYLAVLAASLALRSVNILAVQVHTTEAGAVDDFLIDAPDQLTEADLRAAVEKGRGRDAWISPADAHGLVDPPTQALGQAARLIAAPENLGETLGTLLDCEVTWRPFREPQRYSAHEMTVGDPFGGTLVLTRSATVFTPAEFARAQALAEVAAQVTRTQIAQATVLLPDGAELTLRPAGRADLDDVLALHEQCSPESLYRRYLTGTRGPSAAQLLRLLEPRRGCAMVAVDSDGRVVALANLVGEGEIAEAALLVADAWQRRGIGTALLRRLISLARPAEFAAVLVHTQAANAPMLRTVRRIAEGLTVDPAYDRDGAFITITLALNENRVPTR
ncbi:MAG: GNAT family N-acetyltransferase [Hamadaea sp.]|uniref:GNAT family N-acetyltransferase n=1 Tax=Hamadaea sp. TaxID=2024425 RepID=UPI0017A981E8|nr:GNAT family N-acetyltransferase [Hamadaea sp.]NUR71993.1 GNAT family N-acetyltransferase [Hamadaea sp.]NUT21045.1 GNAT family N-acetyltransferase [Hamadaea sp.]